MMLLAGLMSQRASAQTRIDIEIDGVEEALETNVRLYLSLEQQKDNPLLDDRQIRRLHLKARSEIAAAMEPYGYYRPEVTASLSREEDNGWRAVYTIDPGEPIRIEAFEFSIGSEMGKDPEFETLIEERLPRTGSVFSHLDYEAFKSGLARLANERGYFAAEFTRQRVEVDLEAYAVRVYLDYAGGPRYRFGELQLSQDVLDEDLLRRFVPFRRGDPYLLDRLIEFQRALNNSDYFHQVEITPGEVDNASLEVPIQVRLEPRKRHRYDVGFGYGTDTGARVQFGWRMPRVNTRGHRFDSELRISEIGHSATANYHVPVFNPRTDEIVYSVGEVEEEFDNGTSTVRTAGVSLNHGRGRWREVLSLEYQREEFPLDDQQERSTLLIPGASWSRTWGSDFINVLDGLRLDFGLRGADDGFVSGTSFMQFSTDLKFITSFGPRDRVIMRGAIGTTEAGEFEKIPSSIRFFAGGSNSVRGYAYQSLGPTDADGDVVGGKHLLFGSAEYEHYFTDRWGVALFYDVGNAIDDFGDELEEGAGLGVRWKSPVGPVRIDFGNAISDNGNWRLHILIGPDL